MIPDRAIFINDLPVAERLIATLIKMNKKELSADLSPREFVETILSIVARDCGPFGICLLNHYKIYGPGDIGEATFGLIEKGFVSKEEHETIIDFYDIDIDFDKYFLPDKFELVNADIRL